MKLRKLILGTKIRRKLSEITKGVYMNIVDKFDVFGSENL